MSEAEQLYPVQRPAAYERRPSLLAAGPYLAAYEVYCHVYGPQEAMVDFARGCRGGFSAGEIVAFLYARSFPKTEWRARFDEACKGMQAL